MAGGGMTAVLALGLAVIVVPTILNLNMDDDAWGAVTALPNSYAHDRQCLLWHHFNAERTHLTVGPRWMEELANTLTEGNEGATMLDDADGDCMGRNLRARMYIDDFGLLKRLVNKGSWASRPVHCAGLKKVEEMVCKDRHDGDVLVWSHSAIKLSKKLK